MTTHLPAVGAGRMKRSMVRHSKTPLEGTLAEDPDAAHYQLRLFVTGTTPRSARAIRNIRAICEEHLPGRHELEVIDIYQHPEHVRAEQIVVTPTLVKQLPSPVRKLIGDLSDTARVLAGLDIVPRLLSANPENEHAA
jgi:circadian clock protein KaiB